MLVLTRRANERICIGDDIEVVVIGIHGDKVRLAIAAPASVAVHRKEVKDKIDQGIPFRPYHPRPRD
jgi:carbon storage regulator